jgi:hypothetical protein
MGIAEVRSTHPTAIAFQVAENLHKEAKQKASTHVVFQAF